MQDSPTPAPRWILHPALIAAAFVLEVALANKIEPAGFARALAIAILAGIGFTLVGWAIARDRWIGGLIATALILVNISIIPFFFAWQALRDTLGPTASLVAFGLVLFAAVATPAIQRIRVRRGAARIRGPATSGLNRFAAVLVIVIVAFHAGPDLPATVARALNPIQRGSVAPSSELPDIYILLLDGYPRADVLKRKFGIDNSAFLDELRSLGFDVGTRNHSNYVFTQLTLPSLFQMRHLEDVPELAPLIGTPGGHVNALRNALIDSPVLATLRDAGYRIVVTQPGYEHVAMRGAADQVLERGEMNDLERDVLKRTWLLDPLGAVVPTVFTGPPRDRTVHAFDDLTQLASGAGAQPTFTWVHVPAPHLPLVMDADGNSLPLDPRRFDASEIQGFGMTNEEFAAAYQGEITYLNARVLGAVRALTQVPGRPGPVIVIMSDHGYTYDLQDVQARFGNLFAAYTPQEDGLLADAPTPVNLMPILLNRLLGTDFSQSRDRYFLSPSVPQLLELTEVDDPG
jgi:hypothetical protein